MKGISVRSKIENLIIAVATCLASCTFQTTSSRPQSAASEDHRSAPLGNAFTKSTNSILSGAANPCIESPTEADIHLHKSPVSTLSSSYTREYSARSKMLNVNADAGIGLLKARVEFVDSFYKSELSAAYITEFNYDHGTYALSDIRPRVKQIDAAKCGDSFIAQIDVGARLYLALIINFTEKRDKQSVAVKLILDLFFGEIPIITAEIAQKLADITATVDLKIVQIGGNDSEFRQKIPQSEVASCGYISKIDPNNPDPLSTLRRCIDIYRSYLSYARNDFYQQIKNPSFDPLGNKVGNLAPISVRAKSYREAGYWWIQPNPAINQNEVSRRKIIEEVDELTMTYRAANYSLQRILDDSQLGQLSVFKLDNQKIALARQSLSCTQASIASLSHTRQVCLEPGSHGATNCMSSFDKISVFEIPYFESSARVGATSRKQIKCVETKDSL